MPGPRRWTHIHLAVIELVPAPIVRPALEVGVRDLLLLDLHGLHFSIVNDDVSSVRKLYRQLSFLLVAVNRMNEDCAIVLIFEDSAMAISVSEGKNFSYSDVANE